VTAGGRDGCGGGLAAWVNGATMDGAPRRSENCWPFRERGEENEVGLDGAG
jgi:hypothetical protein